MKGNTMKPYTVTVTADEVLITDDTGKPVDLLDLPGNEFEIGVLNHILWKLGWSVSGPWRSRIEDGHLRLVSIALRRP